MVSAQPRNAVSRAGVRLRHWVPALLLLAAATAQAGIFSVSPVRMFMTPRDRALAVTVLNEGAEELVMQAEVFTWKQKPGGEDELTPTEDLILSPPIIKLAPNAKQVVRLARINMQPVNQQATYRLIVREVPEARPPEKGLQLQIALAFSLPVFITPPDAKRQYGCTVARVAADTVRAACENSGATYVLPREFTLTSPAGATLARRDQGAYILTGMKREFELKRGDGPIPAGPAKLSVLLDDGTTNSFDVTVP